MKIVLALLLFAVSAFSAFSQDVQDISQSNTPLRVSGTFDNILGQNRTNKDMLAYVVIFQTLSNHARVNFSQDDYALPRMLAANSVQAIYDVDPETASLDLATTIQARVVWVQYADGTTWGDTTNDTVADLLRARVGLRQFLEQVSTANSLTVMSLLAQIQGDAQQSQVARDMAAHYLTMRSSDVMSDVASRLAAVALHNKTMQPKTP
jgi:hypothetical protein